MKFGCEIEGYVKTSEDSEALHDLINSFGWEYGSDGSISPQESCYETLEIQTTPYLRKDYELFLQHIEQIYNYMKFNSTCGLHIHLSFDDMSNYFSLLDWGFVSKFQDAYNDKFKEECEQERKLNRYSRFFKDKKDYEYKTQNQTYEQSKSRERYTAINFNAYNLYKTIEFRIFPAATSPHKFKDYLVWLLEFVADYINTNKEVKKVIKHKILLRSTKTLIIDLDNKDKIARKLSKNKEYNKCDRLIIDEATRSLFESYIGRNRG